MNKGIKGLHDSAELWISGIKVYGIKYSKTQPPTVVLATRRDCVVPESHV